MPDGASHREHLLSVERQTGERPEALDGPQLPMDGAHVWNWFLTLHQGRGIGAFGSSPVSFLDVYAWVNLTRTIIRPDEVMAIMAIDRVWLAQEAQQAAPKRPPEPKE